jgi:hypothetical protein
MNRLLIAVAAVLVIAHGAFAETASQIPGKFSLTWGQNAGGGFITVPIPAPSQQGVTPGRASLNDGFPPLTFQPITAGGVPPFGQDMNGILNELSAWNQWYQMGGPIQWDSTFSGQIGGYPNGSLVASTVTVGHFWLSTADANASNPDAGGANWTAVQANVLPQTGAQLQFTSATVLTLAPMAGGYLWINGWNYPVPASLTLSNGGLSASTLYYIYASISGGNVVLSASMTGYTLAANGIPQMAATPADTLVGMAYTNGSAQFVQQDGSWQVRTYFQSTLQRSRTRFSTARTTNSSIFVEINTEIRNSFLVWANENVQFMVSGAQQSSSGGTFATTGVGFDGTTAEQELGSINGPAGNGYIGSIGVDGVKTGLSEGLHYATLLGASGGGTATWAGGAATPSNPSPSLTIALRH